VRFVTLATDYDGTLARDGAVAAETVAALEAPRAAGRLVVLVSGRGAADLAEVFPRLDVCDRVVAENGGVLYDPRSGHKHRLTSQPDAGLVRALHEAGVEPLVVGDTMIATLRPYDEVLLRESRELGLDLEISSNRGAVMALPRGVNKASGLRAALADLGLEPAQAFGVGDAENDLPFLRLCACSCAVGNALPEVREEAQAVTRGEYGDGVIEAIALLLGDQCGGDARDALRRAL
jgi:hydroxymethylpyrimidine pyrophosphatase-like HAD family hydrolase